MRVSDAFPSKYLSAADLDGGTMAVTIDRWEMEQFEDKNTKQTRNKPVLYFRHHKKGVALNVTNARKIAELYGDEMDDWIGRELVLFTAMVDSFGETVEAIRVRAPQPKDRPINDPSRQSSRITTAPQRMQANEPPPWEPEN